MEALQSTRVVFVSLRPVGHPIREGGENLFPHVDPAGVARVFCRASLVTYALIDGSDEARLEATRSGLKMGEGCGRRTEEE